MDQLELTWRSPVDGLIEQLDGVDLASTRATKFGPLAAWLAEEWGIDPGKVVCKYVQHSKNRWNRLREALRRSPAAVMLLFEGEGYGDLESRLVESAAACPDLSFVLVLTRPSGGGWRPSALFASVDATLPDSLADDAALPVQRFQAAVGVAPSMPADALDPVAALELREALLALGIATGDPESPLRPRVAEALRVLTGLSRDRVAFKTIPTTKNLGNRLGEALARAPAVLVVVCPESLEERVLEEAERWVDNAATTLVLVLCGEETVLQVEGPSGELDERLREALEAPAPQPVGGPSAPAHRIDLPSAPLPRQDWRRWSYADWNDRLIDYCLGDGVSGSGPLERLAATPEELVLVAGAIGDEMAEVAAAFVRTCVANVPLGTSFCGFCGDYKGRNRRSDNPWTTASDEAPHFFAMLWFTCLVAYGYPDAAGSFSDRLWRLVGNADHIKCLPELWADLGRWSERQTATARDIRPIVLPQDVGTRTTIGHSHFLAFPHQPDRRLIARVLTEAGLVGFEPPITPVIAALQDERGRFSRLFREDLDNFVSRFVEGSRDPRDSAFWRAVRQEALDPSFNSASRRGRRGRTTILAVFDNEGGLLPLLGCSGDWTPPPGYLVKPLDNPIGGFTHYAEADDGGLDAVVDAVFGSFSLLGPGPRSIINQGILVFQEDQSDEFFLATGHDISGADVALVRNDLVPAFRGLFGGDPEPSRLLGWTELTRCQVRPLDQLPAPLLGVVHLQRTMNPPTLRLVGGIKVPGGYLAFEGFLPRVRAPEVEQVRVLLRGERFLPCSHDAEGDWVLPDEVMAELPTQFRVVASWPLGDGRTRTSDLAVNLRRAAIDDNYRQLVGGPYFLEGCRPGQQTIEAGQPIPLSICGADVTGSYDLLSCEPSARFLGPGLGEMALRRRPGFDWLAVGHKGRPELLAFVGDPEAPTAPADRRSPAPGDRRHWKAAFLKARRVMVLGRDGEYRDIAAIPTLQAAQRRMARHAPSKMAVPCGETHLDTVRMHPPNRTAPADLTLTMIDALAGLSARRGGLRYRTVQELFAELTGIRDFRLHQELIRALCEAGALDLVQDQLYSSTRLLARRPRFVAVHRGPTIEATLIGLVTRSRHAEVRRAAQARGLQTDEVQAGSPWQPSLLRVRGASDAVDLIRAELDLEATEWLSWNDPDHVPDHLRAEVELQELWDDVPSEGYSVAKYWLWDTAEFRRLSRPPEGRVRVEQRANRASCSIYVVTVDEAPVLWTYIRNWALLFAYSRADRAPCRLDQRGWVSTAGRSPVHLPLPLGRLCAVLGEGAPGPMIDSRTKLVEGYCYPFGRRVTELVGSVIPTGWLNEEEG